jgi:hypothetical protein
LAFHGFLTPLPYFARFWGNLSWNYAPEKGTPPELSRLHWRDLTSLAKYHERILAETSVSAPRANETKYFSGFVPPLRLLSRLDIHFAKSTSSP